MSTDRKRLQTSSKEMPRPMTRWEQDGKVSFSASLGFYPGARESCEWKQSSVIFPFAWYRPRCRHQNRGRDWELPGERSTLEQRLRKS